MLVPHDGEEIKRTALETKLLRNLIVTSGVVLFIGACFVTRYAYVMHCATSELKSLEEFRATRAEQEQQIANFTTTTVQLQNNLTEIAKLENAVRQQLQKAGGEETSRSSVERTVTIDLDGAKGGNQGKPLSRLEVLAKQQQSLQNALAGKKANMESLLAKLEDYNYKVEVTPSAWPTDGGSITSMYGGRNNPFGSSYDWHPGIDIAVDYGTPIYATASGTVVHAGWYGGYGRYVRIEHDFGYASAYGHMSELDVTEGKAVQKGDVIGYCGSSGYSTGPHLHFEVLYHGDTVNPLDFL